MVKRCLGYTFYKEEQGACKSAADAVVIYAQNWKSILLNVAKTALIIKTAIIDTYILISTMNAYMKVAPSTEITFDLYSKLCGMSKKIKNLFDRGQVEQQQILQ